LFTCAVSFILQNVTENGRPPIYEIPLYASVADIKLQGAGTWLHIGLYYEEEWKIHLCKFIPGTTEIK